MKRIGIAAALALALPATGMAQELRMHTHVPPVAASYKNLAAWIKDVEAASGGKLKIQLFGSNQLGGKAEDVYGQVSDGLVDLGWTLPSYLPGRFPRTAVFELPFIGDRASVVAPAVWEFYQKWGKEEFGQTHPLVLHVGGSFVLHMKSKEVKRLEDIKDLKIRTPSREMSDAIKGMGAVPVPIPGLGMTEAMMRGVIDGALAPWSIALAIRQIDVATSHTEAAFSQPVLGMFMNKAAYAKLPAESKKAIDETTGAKLAVAFGKKWEEDDTPGQNKAKSLGHPINVLSDAESARWAKAAEPVIDDWIKEMTAKGHPGKQLVDDARAMIAKHKKQMMH
jgi:TRAP-type C4-dicarboxylate transport system substrate-binding protein